MKCIAAFTGTVVFILSGITWAQSPQSRPAEPAVAVSWPATDALGRTLPMPDEVGPTKPDRFVGIFYFLWLQERDNKSPQGNGPYDISRILAADPDALSKPDSPLWGPFWKFHYWSEPLFGYYLGNDFWVLRRHAQMLADAGIDTLIFDTTNALTYPEIYMALCKTFQQVRADGGRTPQISFMVNTHAGATAEKIFKELYEPNLYPELWFRWQGKPLLICDPQQASPKLQEFFTLRRAHWPFDLVNTPYAWHWESIYPQVYGYTDDPNKPEQVNVAVAQNLNVSPKGEVTNMSRGDARGRSFHRGAMDTAPGAINHGHNFQEQWTRALELAPPFVMVTGWNEWIAGRQPGKEVIFVDQYNHEYSRDIEPMKGGHADNYYLQLIANVRRYKGLPALPAPSEAVSIRIPGSFDAWQKVTAQFHDHLGETHPRDFEGAGGLRYQNRTGRNDLALAKVARDSENVYFYVRTREPLTPAGDPNWMWLLIDADQNPATGWEGYDFIANHTPDTNGMTWLEKCTGGWKWEKVAKLRVQAHERELHLAIPRSALGLPTQSTSLAIDFKWADNLQQPGDIMDFYISGDVAPEARFKYRFVAK